tara:strand:+ start:1326 stop:1556 length:231 start_codon:yes stop_codon:yes gene_type:complete
MKIKLEIPKEVVVVPERRITISEIEILEIIDSKNEHKLYVITSQLGIINLWTGIEYIANADWTNNDVIEKIKEIYS